MYKKLFGIVILSLLVAGSLSAGSYGSVLRSKEYAQINSSP